VPYVSLSLTQACSNQVYERYTTPNTRCDGSKVVCIQGYTEKNGYCEAPAVNPPTNPVVNPPAVTTTCQQYVTQNQQCDPSSGSKLCCALNSGLVCTLRGLAANAANYSQCACQDKTWIFDNNMCRPRVYGDICVSDDECASKLISNTGFVCRLGRCRCAEGY
jgi:hypothetical protein